MKILGISGPQNSKSFEGASRIQVITNIDSRNRTPLATAVMSSTREIGSASRHYLTMVALVIGLLVIVYLVTIREGHEWGDDFSMYILHARNLAEGKNYFDTGYIYNPLYNSFGPIAYPPVLPVILAPVYKLLGLNLTAMKLLGLLMFFGALFALMMSYRSVLPWRYGAGVIALNALNPYFWDFKDRILSDIPFLFFAYTTLYAIGHHYENHDDTRSSRHWGSMLLIAVLIYLSYGTRVIGGILIPTLILFDVAQKRKLTIFSVAVSLAAAALIIIQASTLPSAGGGYIHWIQDSMQGGLAGMLLNNGFTYAVGLADIWENGYNRLIMYGLHLLIGILALIGLSQRFHQDPKVHEWFFILYIMTLFVIPAPGFRYLIPIIPLYFLYAVLGVKKISGMPSPALRHAVVVAAVAIAMSYVAKFSTMEYGRLSVGVGTPESKELFQFVRQQTEPDSVIIFRKPRALALFSNRKASIYPKPSPPVSSWDVETWNYFQDINARYIILAASWHADGALERRENEWVTDFVERYSERCERIFGNRDFTVYRLHPIPQQPL